jgi:cobalamin biosynthesis protein CobC
MIEPVAHGGALARAIAIHGGERSGWLDLSTGINPVPAALPDVPLEAWRTLPDEHLFNACLDSARAYCRLTPDAALVAGPGVQALIQLLPALRPGKPARILTPTYGEYAHVLGQSIGGVTVVDRLEALETAQVAVIVNPNNPDGRDHDPVQLLHLADRMAARGGLLVVDEAFRDLTPERSVAPHAGRPGLIVLRSFGKFFGLAGLRLGFAAGTQEDIVLLKARLGPWAVSGPALSVGAALMADAQGVQNTGRTIRSLAAAQHAVLTDAGLAVIADTGLFQLVDVPESAALHFALARAHILTRAFDAQPCWLRFGLCADAAARDRLADALKSALRART